MYAIISSFFVSRLITPLIGQLSKPIRGREYGVFRAIAYRFILVNRLIYTTKIAFSSLHKFSVKCTYFRIGTKTLRLPFKSGYDGDARSIKNVATIITLTQTQKRMEK